MRPWLRQTWSAVQQRVPYGIDRLRHVSAALGRLLGQPVGRRRVLIVVAGFFVCLYAAAVLAYVLSIPDIGLRCAFSPSVSRVYEEFLVVPEGQEKPDLQGDQIVQIGDHPVEMWLQLLRALIQLRDEPVQAEFEGSLPDTSLTHIRLNRETLVKVQYIEHEKPGQPRESVWCRMGSPPLDELLRSVLWLFLKAGLFLVGALVFWQRPHDRSAAQFFLLCTVTFGAYLGGYHWWRIVPQPILLLVFMVCSMMLPAVSLHFYLVFPRPKAVLTRWPRLALLVIYGVPALFLSTLVGGYLLARWLFNAGAPAGPGPALTQVLHAILYEIYVYFGVAALWYGASVVCLAHSYHTAADLTERKQVQWILLGALAAVVPFGYTLYLAFLEQESFGGGAAAWPMFAASACFTVAFTISITRYRLMQLDQLIGSGMIYFLVSTAAGLAYYALVLAGMLLVGSRVISGPTLGQALWVSGTALVLMVGLDLVRGRIRSALDRHFRREKTQLDRTLERLSAAVQQLVDPPALARRLLSTSAELLGVSRGAVYLRAGEPPLYHLADHQGPPPPLTELSPGCPLVEAVQTSGTLLARVWPPSAVGPAQRQLLFLGGEAAHALIHDGHILALLLLGPKDRGQYGADDLNLLAAFGQITVPALVSAEGRQTIDTLHRELQAKVEKIGEQQRRILALQGQLLKQGSGGRSQESAVRDQESEKKGTDGVGLTPDSCPLTPTDGSILGSSVQVRQLMQLVKKVSASDMAVLLRGESGTGKELLARALHENSPRVGKPYVKVHCAALSPGLLESELFGHVKGAFTGAHKDKVGRFELADGGTLFLDEIGDVSPEVQTKLLRVLQEKVFERVGSSEAVRADVRVIAATHQDLERLIREGRFREDLFYRLNGFPILVPPLRERREDVPELAQHFLGRYSQKCGKEVTQIDDDALALLKSYDWPGNVRQLENVIERAVVIAEGPVITPDELPPELQPPEDPGLPTPSAGVRGERAERHRKERERLVRALAAADGNKAEAARALGLARSTLVSRLKKHGLS